MLAAVAPPRLRVPPNLAVASSPTPACRRSSPSPGHPPCVRRGSSPCGELDVGRSTWDMLQISLPSAYTKDNLRPLRHQHRRMDRVSVQQPTVEVPWWNLHIEVECKMTLLLGAPGCCKATLVPALAGNINKNLKNTKQTL